MFVKDCCIGTPSADYILSKTDDCGFVGGVQFNQAHATFCSWDIQPGMALIFIKDFVISKEFSSYDI